MDTDTAASVGQSAALSGPQWQPISAVERRVLGVLVEKAKTTSDAYPLSLNALTTGCNQKNNRDPQMQLAADDVSDALDRLRGLNAVLEVHGDSRVARYKHRLYEWLGVDKVELAVMAELLLRGAQTIGELRGRAARMEPIADLAALRPVLDSLIAKRLVAYLTPPQRGAVVTHLLYRPEELEKVHRLHAAGEHEPLDAEPTLARRASEGFPPATPARSVSQAFPAPAPSASANDLAVLKQQIRDLASDVQQLRAALETTAAELRRDVDDVRRQLGM